MVSCATAAGQELYERGMEMKQRQEQLRQQLRSVRAHAACLLSRHQLQWSKVPLYCTAHQSGWLELSSCCMFMGLPDMCKQCVAHCLCSCASHGIPGHVPSRQQGLTHHKTLCLTFQLLQSLNHGISETLASYRLPLFAVPCLLSLCLVVNLQQLLGHVLDAFQLRPELGTLQSPVPNTMFLPQEALLILYKGYAGRVGGVQSPVPPCSPLEPPDLWLGGAAAGGVHPGQCHDPVTGSQAPAA